MQKTKKRTKNEILKKVLITIITIIILILIIELIFHFLFSGNIFNPPNTEQEISTREYTYIAKTNNQGLREEKEYNKNSNTFRIAFIGDSVVFGSGVESNKTFVKQLEKTLNNPETKSQKQVINLAKSRYEVINIGKPGIGLPDYYEMEKEAIEKLDPDLILIGFTVENDIINTQDPRTNQFLKSLYKNSFIFRLVMGTYINLKSSDETFEKYEGVDKSYIMNAIRYPEYYYDSITLESNEIKESFEKSKDYFIKINNYAKENNKELIILLIPSSMQLTDTSYQFLQDIGYKITPELLDNTNIQDESISFFNTQSINYIDLHPPLKQTTKLLFFTTDLHFTEEGHQIVAEEIAKSLINTSFI